MFHSPTKKDLLPWAPEAFNDLTWDQLHAGRGTASVGKGYHQKLFPSLANKGAHWLLLYTASGSFAWSPIKSTLTSTQDQVVMEITRNMLGNDKSRILRVNNGEAFSIDQNGNDWRLKNEKGSVMAVWQRGAIYEKFPLDEEALALGNPDGPHVYGSVIAGDKLLGEMIIVMGTSTMARFIHQTPAPLLRNVPEMLTPQQRDFLLCFLMFQVTRI